MFFPRQMYSKDKRYNHMKKNISKYDNIIRNQIKEKDSLELRITTFHNLLDLLRENSNVNLYSLKEKTPGSMYIGDFGLLSILEDIYCLLGLKKDCNADNSPVYVPQSWMASKRANKLTLGKPPIYFKNISAIPSNLYNNDYI